MFKPWGLLFTVLFSVQSFAQSACYSEVTSPVLNLYQQRSGENLELLCKELESEEMYEREGFLYKIALGITNFIGVGGLWGLGASAFSKLEGSPWQIEYKKQILEIKKIPDRIERIRQVYLLVSRTQGFYDYETAGLRTDFKEGWMVGALRPENLIDSAHKYGTAGICRQFAALMYWSLLQVARAEGSVGGALGEGDFSMSFVSGEVPWDGKIIGHAWIRVHLPIRQNGILEFQDFDLDTTIFPGTFVMLIPRRSGLPTQERLDLISQCRQLQKCSAEK
jgi:hypothetical protein